EASSASGTSTSATGGSSATSTEGLATASSAGGATSATSIGGAASTTSASTTGAVGSDGSDGDYYVAVDGKDSNPGTIDEPFATMQRAIEAAEAGDLVYVRGGVYEIVEGARPDAGIVFSKSGTSDSNRIRYFA